MFTLMRDPVILPSSRTVIDRATIKSHLLSDSKDPFNRIPLTINEVIPGKPPWCFLLHRIDIGHIDLELKARIDAFVVERRSQKAKSGKPTKDVDVVMD